MPYYDKEVASLERNILELNNRIQKSAERINELNFEIRANFEKQMFYKVLTVEQNMIVQHRDILIKQRNQLNKDLVSLKRVVDIQDRAKKQEKVAFRNQERLLDKEIELENLRRENNRADMEDMRDFYNDLNGD